MKLGNLVEISNGFAFESSKYMTRGIRVIRITNVQKGRIEDNDPKYYDPGTLSQLGRYSIEAGDILMSLTGNVGRVGLFPEELTPAYLNQRVARIRVSKNELDKKYLYYVLNSDKFENDAIHNSAGVAQLNLSTKWLSEYEIPLPPLEEQKKIAAILDAADNYRQKTKSLIEKYDKLTQSLFLDMFGDHLNNSKGWDIVELTRVVELVTKGTTPTSLGDKFSDSGIKFLRAQNVLDGKVIIDEDILFIDEKTHSTKLKRSHIKNGDVLLTIAGTIGRTAIVEVNEELNCNQAIAIIRLGNSPIHPVFLCHFFASNGAQSQFSKGKVTATISNLSLSQIKKLQIPNPHISIQVKFAESVAQIEKQKQQAEESLVKAEELFNSLLQRAFNGELTN